MPDDANPKQQVDRERATRAVAAALETFRRELDGANGITNFLRNVQHLVTGSWAL